MIEVRKPPVEHVVKGHIRNGKGIKSYTRGKGQRSKRSSKVVGDTRGDFYRQAYLKMDSDFEYPEQLHDISEMM